MGEEPNTSVDFDDFWEFIESIQDTFLVSIDIDTAMECKNLGAFVRLVYREITANRVLLHDQDLMRDRMIKQLIAVSMAETSEPFKHDDMNIELEPLLRSRAKNDWAILHYRVRSVVGACAGEVCLRLWSKILGWLLFSLFLAGAVLVGINFGFGFSIVLFLVGTIILLSLISVFPNGLKEPEKTLGQAIDQRIERLKECQKGMSIYDVQSCIFDMYESWDGIPDSASISGETPFPNSKCSQ